MIQRVQECAYDRLPNEMSDQLIHQLKNAKVETQSSINRTKEEISRYLANTEEWMLRYFAEEEEKVTVQSQQLLDSLPSLPNINPNDDITTVNQKVVKASSALLAFEENKTTVLGVFGEFADRLGLRLETLKRTLLEITEAANRCFVNIRREGV